MVFHDHPSCQGKAWEKSPAHHSVLRPWHLFFSAVGWSGRFANSVDGFVGFGKSSLVWMLPLVFGGLIQSSKLVVDGCCVGGTEVSLGDFGLFRPYHQQLM